MNIAGHNRSASHIRGRRPLRSAAACVVSFAAAVVLSLLISQQALARPALISAANQDHLWFVAEPTQSSSRYLLCHRAREMPLEHFDVQCALGQAPSHLASWGNRVWVVFESTHNSTRRREVFTIEVWKDSTIGAYRSTPADRMDIAPGLPAQGHLAGFVGSAGGPIALLVPQSASPSGLLTPAKEKPAPDGLAKPVLLQLRHDQWTELPVPPEFTGDRRAILAACGSDGGQLCLLEPAAENAMSLFHLQEAEWTRRTINLDVRSLRDLDIVGGQLVALVAGASDAEIATFIVRPAGLMRLAQFPQPQGAWSAAGSDDGLHVLSRHADGQLFMQTVQPLSGAVGTTIALSVNPLSSARLWNLSVLVALMASALLLIFLVRPAEEGKVALPAGVTPLSAGQRIAALAIDLFPAGVLTALVLQNPLGDLFRLPIVTMSLELSLPYLMMVGLTILHSSVSEILTGKTLGKAMVGARIAARDGSPPRIEQLLLRNFLKCFVLLVPPLALFSLFNPHLQGLPDLAARTIVVHEPEASPAK